MPQQLSNTDAMHGENVHHQTLHHDPSRLQHRFAMLPPPPSAGFLPPRPAGSFQAVHIASLEAALAKLNIKIPIENVMKAIHEEEEARRVEQTAEVTRRRAAPSKRELAPN
jgi:hypothetical protein